MPNDRWKADQLAILHSVAKDLNWALSRTDPDSGRMGDLMTINCYFMMNEKENVQHKQTHLQRQRQQQLPTDSRS